MKLSKLFRRRGGRHLEETQAPELSNTFEEPNVEPNYSRTAHLKQTLQEKKAAKHQRLARRLNWIIFYLVIAIIIVYCFMIFINF